MARENVRLGNGNYGKHRTSRTPKIMIAKKDEKTRGRPKKTIDGETVEELAAIGCTNTEIASIVRCSVDTLDRRFAEEMDKGRSNCKKRLRQVQMDAALGGNIVMMIFLGKQMLGQSDKIETNISASVNQDKEITTAEVKKYKKEFDKRY
jgi:hypothetical protein